jgi:hypothetical protein
MRRHFQCADLYAIFVPLLAPFVFYTGACMIRIESHGWNIEIKRPDQPIGQRAIEKNKMRAAAKNAGYSYQT